MLKRHNRMLLGTLLTADLIAVSVAFMSAYYIRFYSGLINIQEYQIPPLQQYLKILPLILLIFPAVYAVNGLYKIRRGRSGIDEFFSIFVSSSLATIMVFLGLLYYKVYHTPDVAPEWEFSRISLAVFLAASIMLVSGVRFMIRGVMDALRRRGINIHHILIGGAGDLGRTLVDRIVAHEEFGLRAVGMLDDDDRKRGSVYQGVRVIGTLKDLHHVLSEHRVDMLFIALPPTASRKIIKLIDVANKHCIDVRVVPDLLQYISLRATVEEFDGLPIINFDRTPLQGFNRVLKRTVDIVFSLVGLALTAVLFPFLAVGIKLSGHGPILFKQERMGLDGKPFTLHKFRTMSVDAESSGPVWAKTDDPRATKLGMFMRRTSLDELPQFWNVFKGNMSLVGPRPERPEFVREFREHFTNYMLRHKMKAGMTGWAQINGWRGDTSIEKRVEYDLYYIQNWSLALDFKIIWLTVFRSMLGRSQY